MKATVKESGIILDPKQFLEWGHQQLKKIEKERLHKSSKVVMVCLKEKGKNIKIDGDFMNETYDDCQDTVKKKKKKKKGQSEQETISSINIELNKQTKQSEEDETKKRKRSGCVDEVEESESSSSKKKEGGKKKKTKAQAEDSNDERKTKKGKRAAGKGIPIRAEESDLPSNDKKKKKRQTSVDEETERPKKKKRKIAEDSLSWDASTGKRKKQDTATYLHHSDSDHEFSSSKKKKNTQHLETQPNGDIHSKYTDHAESNLSKHKKKKKKKKRENVNEVETEEDQQLLETKRRKKAELKEIVELDYSNDTHIKKKKKKKKEDNSEASDNTCSSLSHKRKKSKEDGFENGDSIHEKKRIRSSEVDERIVSSKRSEQAHCCGHCPSSSRPGFGKSPISRLLSKNMTCDICPGKLYHQELEDIPSTPKTPVVIKQERMEDWVGYNIEKELDISARVKKEPEEQLVNAAPSLMIKSEKTDNRDVQEKQTGDEQPVAEMNAVWIKEERLDGNEASPENDDDNIRPAESVKVEIVVEEVSEAVAPSNDNTSLDNNIENDNNNKYRNNNDDDDYNINNTTGTENICSTENNILQSDEVDSSTYINFYDDNFIFKDEFVNFDETGDQTAIDPLQEAGNKDSDYLQCVISQFSSEASDRTMLQCTISAQDEGRRVTALDAESEMLHFMNVYPKFQDRLQVSRILKVPIKHTYFHHYVVGTKELMDVYVQFKSQQDLKTAMQFYARRVRCEQWCTVQERSLPQEIENDPDANEVQNPYQWCCEGYKKPSSQNRDTPRQQKKRYYQHRRRKQNSRQVNWKGSGSARRRC